MKTQWCKTSLNHWVYSGTPPTYDHYCRWRSLDYLMQRPCSPTTSKYAIAKCCSSNNPGSPDRPQSNICGQGRACIWHRLNYCHILSVTTCIAGYRPGLLKKKVKNTINKIFFCHYAFAFHFSDTDRAWHYIFSPKLLIVGFFLYSLSKSDLGFGFWRGWGTSCFR